MKLLSRALVIAIAMSTAINVNGNDLAAAKRTKSAKKVKTEVIAHRGYWKHEGSAQNSIAGLRLAAEAKVYGSEFDVSITADGVLVVNHDADINGVDIESSNYDQIKDMKLPNGETLPTLEQYLVEGKKHPKLQLIFEMKPHKSIENENKAVKESVRIIKELGIEKQVEFISFSMNICERYVEQLPKAKVAYLGSKTTPEELDSKSINGIDAHYNVYIENNDWIERAHKLGFKVNVWTVNDDELAEKLIGMGVDYITTDRPVETAAVIKNTLSKK